MDRRAMDRRMGTGNWIGAYLEWTHSDGWAFRPGPVARSGLGAAGADTSEAYAVAYLDWMDVKQQLSELDLRYHAAAPANDPVEIGDDMSGLDVFREALMVALHTESDCIQFLRRILDVGDATPRTVTLALEALEHAERLLEDERRAWRSLTVLSRSDLPQSSTGSQSDFETNWPLAIENVAADVRALTSTVLALQTH